MDLVTYSNIKTKLYNDLDLHDEDFITEAEFLGYLNEAMDDAEAVIHNLGLESRYFLTTDTLALVSGTADYTLPSDIYANKMIKVHYVNGSKSYEIERVRELNEIPLFTSGEDYKYLIFNLTAGVKMRIYPTPAENGAYVNRYYIRNMRALTTSTASTNTCEIPESINFIMQHTKVRVYEKEGNPNLPKAINDLKIQHDLMVQNLQEMVPDGNNKIMPEMDFYSDQAMEVTFR